MLIMNTKTKTLFRTFLGSNEVIALFPEIPADNHPAHCLSYQTIGQHGAASVDLNSVTRPSTKEEIDELTRELEKIGYTVQLIKRVSQFMHLNRWNVMKG